MRRLRGTRKTHRIANRGPHVGQVEAKAIRKLQKPWREDIVLEAVGEQ